jgi:acyl-CoA reductase-like NAD-dependent aldehyde dehydrogenase
LVTDPDVDKVAFTGSTETGKQVMARAAGTLKRLSLELGGKSPLIVMPDADPEAASDAALECFYNSGQQCNVPSRLVVPGGTSADVVDLVVRKVAGRRLGADDDADLGPLVDEAQRDRVVAFLSLAESDGGKVLIGGEEAVPGDLEGPFVAPTVIGDLDPDSRLVREEIFGPVLVIQSADDLDDAIAVANGGDFGLAAGIFTADLDAALHASERLRAGTVWVNTWNKTYPELPTGGFGASGMGRELGLEGLDAYLEPKTVQMQPGRPG